MTRKHYQLIAEAIYSTIRAYHPWAISNVTKEVIESIAEALASDNPRFDRKRFIEACGLVTDADLADHDLDLATRDQSLYDLVKDN